MKPLNKLFGARVELGCVYKSFPFDKSYMIVAAGMDEAREILEERIKGLAYEIRSVNIWEESFPIVEVK